MTGSDFMKFVTVLGKLQKVDESRLTDANNMCNGLYVLRYGDDIILAGTNGHVLMWEKMDTVDTTGTSVSSLPGGAIAAAQEEGYFPFKITHKEMMSAVAVMKAIGIKGRRVANKLIWEAFDKNNIRISVDHLVATIPVVSAGQKDVEKFHTLLRTMVCEAGVSENAKYKLYTGVDAVHNPEELSVLLSWIANHDSKPYGVELPVYGQENVDKEFYPVFAQINPVSRSAGGEDDDKYGAVIMAMRMLDN